MFRRLDLWWYRLWWKIGFFTGAREWPPEWIVPTKKGD